jgi:hypothetical protein
MDDDRALPFVVNFETGTLPDKGVCLRLIYGKGGSSTADALDSVVYAMDQKTAKELAQALQTASVAEHPLTRG